MDINMEKLASDVANKVIEKLAAGWGAGAGAIRSAMMPQTAAGSAISGTTESNLRKIWNVDDIKADVSKQVTNKATRAVNQGIQNAKGLGSQVTNAAKSIANSVGNYGANIAKQNPAIGGAVNFAGDAAKSLVKGTQNVNMKDFAIGAAKQSVQPAVDKAKNWWNNVTGGNAQAPVQPAPSVPEAPKAPESVKPPTPPQPDPGQPPRAAQAPQPKAIGMKFNA